MKKTLILLILFSVMISVALPISASTSNTNIGPENKDIIFFDDGSYLITEIKFDIDNNNYTTASTTYNKRGTKTANYYSNDDELLWVYTLTGEFTVTNGISATCTNATHSKTIYSSKWSFSDESTYAARNVAHGKGVFKKKVLLITMETVDVDLSITCDVYGNLS